MRGYLKSSYAILVAIVFFTFTSWSYPLRPNPKWTPGSLCNKNNSDYTEDRYPEKIPYCTRNVSYELKTEIYKIYNIPDKCRHRYTIDHLIPLSIGGDNSIENLWPEHKLIKAERPDLELEVFEQLRNGEISQEEAIATILKEKKSFGSRAQNTAACDREL